jgi:hypothetical protein
MFVAAKNFKAMVILEGMVSIQHIYSVTGTYTRLKRLANNTLAYLYRVTLTKKKKVL